MAKRDTSAHIAELIETANGLAIDKVEEMARQILRDRKRLDEFVMGMGIATFTSGEMGTYDLDDMEYMWPLRDFIREWDDVLKLPGQPMRFTANGPKITEW